MNGIEQLSIVIVTWNGDGLLKNCLDSVRRVYGDVPEIVVVDNANQASCATLAKEYPNVTYVAAPENLGFAGGNNLALPHVTRDYILLLNNDTIVHEDSFTPLLDFLAAHPKVGIVQGTMNIPARNNGLDVCGEDLWPWGILHHRLVGQPTATTPLKAKKVFAAKGAMLMMKRQVLADVGGRFFDPAFKNYFEDIDLCFRARNAGWETWFVPTPPIDHLCGQTAGKFKHEDIWAQYFRNILVSYHRNFGFWGHVFTIPCFICAALIRAPKALFKALQSLRQQPATTTSVDQGTGQPTP